MNEAIRHLEPTAVWNHFVDLNAVPRASKKEEQVRSFMVAFGKQLGLETFEDEVGNVFIRKPASEGMEDRETLVLQGHLDMVHQKNNDTSFDFATQGIEMFVEGDWVKAKGTTLGADNGLGVAAIMAILSSKDISHPAIEALFTIDEETGMTGAKGLKGGLLSGKILLNLDTEEDDEISVGCAGGVDVTATGTYQPQAPSGSSSCFTITVNGLKGGHSGMDIIKGLGNANKLMNRILYAVKDSCQIGQIEGGGLRNAIPRESVAQVSVSDEAAFKHTFQKISDAIRHEYGHQEEALMISCEPAQGHCSSLMSSKDQEALLRALMAAHNGVYRMSPEIEGLVEASNNVAKVEVKDGNIMIACLTRSSVDSSKADVANQLKASFESNGYEVSCTGDYPGWAPNMDSQILTILKTAYARLRGSEPGVSAVHAGLECGLLGTHYPDMEMISFGPTIKGAHSPEERASISSSQKFWELLLEVIKETPKRQ